MNSRFNTTHVLLAFTGSLLLFSAGCSQKAESESSPVDQAAEPSNTMTEAISDEQKIFSTLGYTVGTDLMMESFTEEQVKHIVAGIELSASGEKPDYVGEFTDRAIQILQTNASRRAQERQSSEVTENKAAGEAFLKTLDGKDGVVKSDSGLYYEILKEGSDKYATAADKVNVHYHGTLIDGTVFDSSVNRGEPITFPLNGVIPGFSEGLTLVGEGGKIRLYMPSHIAYGDNGAGAMIGPGATLVFEVELLKINP